MSAPPPESRSQARRLAVQRGAPRCRNCGATLETERQVSNELCPFCLDRMLREEDDWREDAWPRRLPLDHRSEP